MPPPVEIIARCAAVGVNEWTTAGTPKATAVQMTIVPGTFDGYQVLGGSISLSLVNGARPIEIGEHYDVTIKRRPRP